MQPYQIAMSALAAVGSGILMSFIGALLMSGTGKGRRGCIVATIFGMIGFISTFIAVFYGRNSFVSDYEGAHLLGMMLFGVSLMPMVGAFYVAAGLKPLISTIVLCAVAVVIFVLVRLPQGFGGFFLAGTLWLIGVIVCVLGLVGVQL